MPSSRSGVTFPALPVDGRTSKVDGNREPTTPLAQFNVDVRGWQVMAGFGKAGALQEIKGFLDTAIGVIVRKADKSVIERLDRSAH
jgi:hypothetical protein